MSDPQTDRQALVEDAVKFLRLLREPCAKHDADDHNWHRCRRCLAEFDLSSQQDYAVKLMDAAIAALAALSAPPTPEGWRDAVSAGWDDGVRFAAEVLRSQVYPREAAREACVDRVLASLPAPEGWQKGAPEPDSKEVR